LHLQAKTDVKVLRDMCIRPPLSFTIWWIHEWNALDCLPSEEGIVADKGRYITTTNTIFDSRVYNIGEVGDFLSSKLASEKMKK
jgi:hypothetical protein